MGIYFSFDKYAIKNLCTKNGAFIHPVTIILLSYLYLCPDIFYVHFIFSDTDGLESPILRLMIPYDPLSHFLFIYQSTHHIKRKNGGRNVRKVIFASKRMPPTINYVMEGEVAIALCFQLCMLHPLHSVTNEEQYEKRLCNQSSCYGKYR